MLAGWRISNLGSKVIADIASEKSDAAMAHAKEDYLMFTSNTGPGGN